MATEEFLSCLSRGALERLAAVEGVRVEVRVKDTRARMVERFKDGRWLYPAGVFTPSAEALADLAPDEGDETGGEADIEEGEGAGPIVDDRIEDLEGIVPLPVALPSPALAIAAE